MKYLKLFEGFSDDFYTDLKSLEDKYNSDKKNLLKRYKDEVDQFMFDLTDDYSDPYQNDFIENDDPSIWYYLKCEWEDFEKVISILQEVNERLKSALNLKIILTAQIDFVIQINNGFKMSVEELFKYHKEYFTRFGRSEESMKMIDNFKCVRLKINILEEIDE